MTNLRSLLLMHCVPRRYYFVLWNRRWGRSDQACGSSIDGKKSFFLDPTSQTCVQTCPSRFRADLGMIASEWPFGFCSSDYKQETSKCIACADGALSCTADGLAQSCGKSVDGSKTYYLDTTTSKCDTTCPTRTYIDTGRSAVHQGLET